jgi:hypothetical protein
VSRIAANVCHPNIHFFTKEPKVLWPGNPHVLAVDIAVNRLQGFESRQQVSRFRVSDISGMPYFIHIFSKCKQLCRQITMRVGEQSYTFHFSGIMVC